MVTGALPFHGQSAGVICEAIMNRAPVAVVRLNQDVPAKLEDIINRALEKDRELRFQHAADMRSELLRLKRDTETGRAIAASSGTVAVAQESSSEATQPKSAEPESAQARAAQPPSPAPGASPAVAPSPSSSAVKVAEVPVAGRKLWKVLVPAAVILVAVAIAGAFYYRSRSGKHLTDKDTIVLADFANTTGDPVFDDTLKQALTVDLQQSPFLNVLSDEKVNETLKLMNRSPHDRQTQEVAREICLRSGSKAMLAGSIAALGSHFAITLKAMNCQSGDSLGSAEAEADSREKVLGALGQAATDLRGKMGESLSSIQKFDKPLEQVTTSSLEALKAYTEAYKIANEKGDMEALPFLKRAIELDPSFAEGYLGLGVSYGNLGQDHLSRENYTKAYELRERVSKRERYEIVTSYYQSVTGELERAAQQYELYIHDFPRDSDARGNLGVLYTQLSQYERAAALNREALEIDPDASVAYANLAVDYMYLNRLDEAKGALDKALARKLDVDFVRYGMYALAFLQNDPGGMKVQVEWAIAKPGSESGFLALQSGTEAYYGRLRKAREFTRRSVDSAMRNDAKEVAADYEARAAVREAEFGDGAETRRQAAAALALFPTGLYPRLSAALALAQIGDDRQAQKIVDRLNDDFPHDTLVQQYWIPSIRARIEVAHGDAANAIELVRAASPYDLSGGGNLLPAFVRGQAYLLARNGTAAVAEFQKLLDHPGIVMNSPLGARAHLEIGRAYAMAGDTTKAKIAYQDFLTLWKDSA